MSENRLIIPKTFSYERLVFQCNPNLNVRCKKGYGCQDMCFKTTEEEAADIAFIGPPELIIKDDWKPKKKRSPYKKLKGVH